jgi:hypothetical protein
MSAFGCGLYLSGRRTKIDICLESQQKTGKTICEEKMISAKGSAAQSCH